MQKHSQNSKAMLHLASSIYFTKEFVFHYSLQYNTFYKGDEHQMKKFSFLTRKKSRDVDMTEGSIMRHLINFAIPLLVGNIFQQLYNMVDLSKG